MAKWEELLEDEQRRRTKRINKNVYCKKNKLNNGKYGYHQYPPNETRCSLCGHKNKPKREIENDESGFSS